MTKEIAFGFEQTCVELPLDRLVPSKLVSKSTKRSKRFRQIVDSIREVGLVEPLAVHPVKGAEGDYLVLDGHLRIEALKEIERTTASCLITTDDESFTYNRHVNRLSSVQEHYMIVRAIESGVPKERIAQALGIHVRSLHRKQILLKGVCAEAIEILQEARFSEQLSVVLRRMKPLRQIEVAELMVAMNNFASSYARALLFATPPGQLVRSKRKASSHGLTAQQREKMEREMESLSRDIKVVEEHYGTNMLRLVVANGYIGRLLENAAIAGYLQRHHAEINEQLRSLQDSIDSDMGLVAD